MWLDKEKLGKLAQPLDAKVRDRMERRRNDRYWKAASAIIAAKVLRQLKKRGMTRIQLAEKLDVTPANITRYLNGSTNFELRTLVELERTLDIEIINRNVIPVKDRVPVILEIEYTSSESDWAESPSTVSELTNELCYG